MQLCTNSKRIILMTVGYDGHRKGSYEVVGMGGFNQHTAKTNSHRNKDNV